MKPMDTPSKQLLEMQALRQENARLRQELAYVRERLDSMGLIVKDALLAFDRPSPSDLPNADVVRFKPKSEKDDPA